MGRSRARDQHLARIDSAARQDVADRLGPAERKLLVIRRRSGRIGVSFDPDPVVRIPGEDVPEARELLHRSRLEDGAVAAEQQVLSSTARNL